METKKITGNKAQGDKILYLCFETDEKYCSVNKLLEDLSPDSVFTTLKATEDFIENSIYDYQYIIPVKCDYYLTNKPQKTIKDMVRINIKSL